MVMVMRGWASVMLVGKVLIITKLCILAKWVLKPKAELPPAVSVEQGLGAAHNEHYDTYNILNRRNVSFILSPPSCTSTNMPLLLLMVSSGPLNKGNRDR